jgi:D-alanyl-D-alanine carboxypeptidase
MYAYAIDHTLPNLTSARGQNPITGNPDLDERIWRMALERGYVPRPEAAGELVRVDGILMQPQAATAWEGLKAEARANGHRFILSSAYRSVSSQRTWFNSKLSGSSDQAIDETLRWYSIPGTSKHHSGYALDFRYRDGTFAGFRDTPDYAWLSANNFAIPKKYGFIPSYPDGVSDQGPNPEPWEFVWVGADLIECGVPLDLSQSRLASSMRWLVDGGLTCPGGITVTDLDRLLRRLGPKLEVLLTV